MQVWVPIDHDARWSIEDKGVQHHQIASWIVAYVSSVREYRTEKQIIALFKYWEDKVNVMENDQ